jgi:hypothetical protein
VSNTPTLIYNSVIGAILVKGGTLAQRMKMLSEKADAIPHTFKVYIDDKSSRKSAYIFSDMAIEVPGHSHTMPCQEGDEKKELKALKKHIQTKQIIDPQRFHMQKIGLTKHWDSVKSVIIKLIK